MKFQKGLKLLFARNKGGDINYWKVNCKFYYWLSISTIFLLIIFSTFLIFSLDGKKLIDTNEPIYIRADDNITLKFIGDFTEKEKTYYEEEIVEKMNPMFSQFLGSVKVYKDEDKLQKICGEETLGCDFQNSTKGIHVFFIGNEADDRIILCHETLHNIIVGGKDSPTHEVVYFLGGKQICYEMS